MATATHSRLLWLVKSSTKKVVLTADHPLLTRATVRDFLATLPGHKTVIIEQIPTVENLARTAFNILKAAYQDRYGTGLRLHKLVLHETPNCWAEISGDD